MVHANLRIDSGFKGAPNDLVGAFVDHVGQEGTLMMVSQPFRGYAYDYLHLGKPFDVRRTVSMMGLVPEMFRRRAGTLRSLHPTHPVLVYGKDAEQIIAGHESTRYPCGKGTPFEALKERGGKILFFDVSSGANTFFHHVEDSIKDRLPVRLYDPELFEVEVIDAAGAKQIVETYAFATGNVRNTARLDAELAQRNLLVRARVGNSRMTLVESRDVENVMVELIDSGVGLIEPARN
jgi:aminoglycoside N3'-acetyltransferase